MIFKLAYVAACLADVLTTKKAASLSGKELLPWLRPMNASARMAFQLVYYTVIYSLLSQFDAPSYAYGLAGLLPAAAAVNNYVRMR